MTVLGPGLSSGGIMVLTPSGHTMLFMDGTVGFKISEMG